MALLADHSFMTLTRHHEYYIPSADLSILVENVQFRVHKFFFERESHYFAARLSTPATPGTALQGSGDGNAIKLDGLTVDEFARFLWVFYNRKYSIYEADTEDWASILTLAHRWGFPEVKSLAVRELERKELPDVKRIKLYHDTAVDRALLVPRYAALCARDAPLSLAEGRDLGMETTLMIARGREEARAGRTPGGARSPLTPTLHGADLHAFVRELFEIGAETATEAEAEAAPPYIPAEFANGPPVGNGNGNGHAADPDPELDAEDTAGAAPTEGDQAGGEGGRGNNKKGKGGNGATTDKGDSKAGDAGAGNDVVPDTPSGRGGKNNNNNNNNNSNKGGNKRGKQ